MSRFSLVLLILTVAALSSGSGQIAQWDTIPGTQNIKNINAGTVSILTYLGIKTANPTERLEVGDGGNMLLRAKNGASAEPGFIKFSSSSGDQLGKLWADKSENLYLSSSGATANLTIDDIGQVGIGTSSPAGMLEVTGSGYFSDGGDIRVRSGGGAIGDIIFENSDGSEETARINAVPLNQGGPASLLFSTAGASTDLAIVDNFIGIGTEDPSEMLHIYNSSGNLYTMVEVGTSVHEAKAAFVNQSGDWRIGISPVESFVVTDHTNGASPLQILQGAPQNSLYVTSNGDVGLGTNTPGSQLTVTEEIEIQGSRLHVGADGLIGVGTSSPSDQLHVYDASDNIVATLETASGISTAHLRYKNLDGEWLAGISAGETFQISDATTGTTPVQVYQGAPTNSLIIADDGAIGIGTGPSNTGGYKLAVEGTIGAREINVNTDSWADYVFSDGYDLATLEEVESHIRTKKHLPGIPSESEVLANGINVGEMQAKLLQKIEELTLYVIAQNKSIQVLELLNQDLVKRMSEIEANEK